MNIVIYIRIYKYEFEDAHYPLLTQKMNECFRIKVTTTNHTGKTGKERDNNFITQLRPLTHKNSVAISPPKLQNTSRCPLRSFLCCRRRLVAWMERTQSVAHYHYHRHYLTQIYHHYHHRQSQWRSTIRLGRRMLLDWLPVVIVDAAAADSDAFVVGPIAAAAGVPAETSHHSASFYKQPSGRVCR